MGKSQTATEYLIIVAVVIVIAVVVAGLMGGLPGIGSGTNKKVVDYKLASDTVGIESYVIGADSSLFRLKNNHYDTVTVSEFRVNQQENLTCNSSNTNPSLPIVLNVGESKLINCSVVNSTSYTITSKQTPTVGILYTDSLGAERTAGNVESYGAITINNENPEEPEVPLVCNDSATFHNGAGTAQAPYGICNWEQLNNVRDDLDAHYILLDDLDSNSYNYSGIGNAWMPIGESANHENEFTTNPFSGNFNGNNNTISNLTINLPLAIDYVGLFGYSTGNINNVSFINVNISGYYGVGVLVGLQQGGMISHIYSTGVVSGSYYVGGLVGGLLDGTVTNSYSAANITGVLDRNCGGLIGYLDGTISNSNASGTVTSFDRNVGGLVGYFQSGTILNCSASGDVSGTTEVGGLAGYQNGGTISNSYATGNVVSSGDWDAGGFVGAQSSGAISNSYSTGNVSGNQYIGGFAAYSGGSIINSYSIGFVSASSNYGGFLGPYSNTPVNCYYDSETSGQSDNDGRGVPKTTAEMKKLYTFNSFGGNWNISGGASDLNNGYPYLGWQAGQNNYVWYIADNTITPP